MNKEQIREPPAELRSLGVKSPQSAVANSLVNSDLPSLRQKSQLKTNSQSRLDLFNRYFEKILKRGRPC